MTQTNLSKTYKIPLGGVRRLLFRAVGATGLSLLAGFFAAWYAVRSENDPTSLRFSYEITTLLAIILGIPALWKFRKKLKSFRLVLQEDAILRCQDGSPDVLVKRNEIVRVEEKSSLGLTIRAKGPDKVLRIPAEVAGYLEIRDHLASWGPIVGKFFGGIYFVLFALIATTAVMSLLFGSQNFWFVFPTSVAVLVCLVLAAMRTQQDPAADRYSRFLVCGLVLVTALALTFKVVLTFGYRR